MGFLRDKERELTADKINTSHIAPPSIKGKSYGSGVFKIIFFLISLACLTLGGLIFSQANSAIHEIESGILFLIASVFFVGVGIIEAIDSVRKTIQDKLIQIN